MNEILHCHIIWRHQIRSRMEFKNGNMKNCKDVISQCTLRSKLPSIRSYTVLSLLYLLTIKLSKFSKNQKFSILERYLQKFYMSYMYLYSNFCINQTFVSFEIQNDQDLICKTISEIIAKALQNIACQMNTMLLI